MKVKYYLKNVRKLSKSNYEIREVALDFDTAFILYEDYILQEFEDDCLFLTTRDIIYVNREIETTISQLEKSYDELKAYYDIIRKVPSIQESVSSIRSTLNLMEKHLTKVKTLRKICSAQIKDSVVFSPNMIEYLQQMGYLQEDRELTEMFYRKVASEDE